MANTKKSRAASRQVAEPGKALPRQSGPWRNRVVFAKNGLVAFRPGQLLVTGATALAAANRSLVDRKARVVAEERLFDDSWLIVFEANDPDDERARVESIVADLREQGLTVEPNHVLFAHSSSASGCRCGGCGCGGGFGANPFIANPFIANPFIANPFIANPVGANPFIANPFIANPFIANPFIANPFIANPFIANAGPARSSVLPADAPAPKMVPGVPAQKCRAVILDTGIAVNASLPSLLKLPLHEGAPAADRDRPDEDGDNHLDPAAGHGTFIAGILEQLAPGQEVQVCSVLSTFGDGDAATIASRLVHLLAAGTFTPTTVLNMSFGTYADAEMLVLGDAVRKVQQTGAVVVASAGNDGVPLPSFPASFPGVIGVGSIEECGRAPYSNFGPWVRACAPGTGVVSSFYKSFNGKLEALGAEPDPDSFASWAQWTGTSFAAPIVAAALMRHMALYNTTANDAVAAVIDNPALLRYPCLGTVVNLVPGM